jgi:plastocyanin domain-containing protein
MGVVNIFKFSGFFLLAVLVSAALLQGFTPDEITQTAQQKATLQAQPATEKDGMQIVQLSWGVLNYKPEVIEVKAGMPVRIEGDISRLRGCYRSFIIPSLGVVGTFSEAKPYIDFVPEKKGTFAFSCTMNMARGKIIVS